MNSDRHSLNADGSVFTHNVNLHFGLMQKLEVNILKAKFKSSFPVKNPDRWKLHSLRFHYTLSTALTPEQLVRRPPFLDFVSRLSIEL
jgi:hypothetical protein